MKGATAATQTTPPQLLASSTPTQPERESRDMNAYRSGSTISPESLHAEQEWIWEKVGDSQMMWWNGTEVSI